MFRGCLQSGRAKAEPNSCMQSLCTCIFAPLCWATLILCWVAASGHLAIATVLADFCVDTNGVTALLPADNAETFSYFLFCEGRWTVAESQAAYHPISYSLVKVCAGC